MTTADLLNRRLAALRRQLEVTEEEVRAQQAQIPIIQAKIEEIEYLQQESENADSEDNSFGRKLPQGDFVRWDPLTNGRRIGATDAVIAYLEKAGDTAVHPGSIVDAVVESVASAATDKRRNLFSTIHNLVKSGKLEKTATGRVRLSKGGRQDGEN